jgi:NADPH:quinone reductase-like Zn-dependent oxidoreductase
MKAIRVHRHGGPDVLAYEDIDIGEPAPGEVRVSASSSRIPAVSTVNF